MSDFPCPFCKNQVQIIATENARCYHCHGHPFFSQTPTQVQLFYPLNDKQTKGYIVAYKVDRKTITLSQYQGKILLENYPFKAPTPAYLPEIIMKLLRISKLKAFL